MKLHHSVALGAMLFCAPAVAQAQAPAAQPVAEAAPAPAPAAASVPEITPVAPTSVTIAPGLSVPMSINAELSTSRNKVGESIAFTVTQDVIANGVVVIPRGTRGVGEITMRSGRGMFGKSGKMEIAFRYLDMDGMRVPLEGSHFQAGNGNTAGTVGAVLAAGVVGGLVVTGRSANVAEGTEFTARTVDALPVVITPQTAGTYDRPLARLAATYTPSAIQTGSPREIEEQRRAQAEREARQQQRGRGRRSR
jgi:hypothetical protein